MPQRVGKDEDCNASSTEIIVEKNASYPRGAEFFPAKVCCDTTWLSCPWSHGALIFWWLESGSLVFISLLIEWLVLDNG